MAVNWEVVSQRQTEELTPQGSFEANMEINFRTIPEHIPGQVKVPLRLYTGDYVRSVIDPLAETMQSVQKL